MDPLSSPHQQKNLSELDPSNKTFWIRACQKGCKLLNLYSERDGVGGVDVVVVVVVGGGGGVCVCVWGGGGGGQSGGSKRYISLVHNTSWSTQCAMLTHASGTFFFSYFLSSAHIITTKFVQEYHQSFKHVKILSGPTLNVEPDWIPTICKKVISRRH